MEITRAAIESELRQLGLQTGDAVEVHCSLSSVGRVKGGATAVVDALMNVVGNSGAIVMSNYPLSPPLPLTEEEKASGVGWKLRKLPDDSRERTCTGAVSDEFRWRDDVVVGAGIHRICAWGAEAELHVRGYEHLLDVDGWVLLLGVGIDRCSSLHLGERSTVSADANDRASETAPEQSRFEKLIKQYPPDIVVGPSERSEGPAPWEMARDEADRRGMIRRGTIGAAECMLFRAKGVVTILEHLCV